MREGTAAGSDAAGGMASGGMGGMRTQSSTGARAKHGDHSEDLANSERKAKLASAVSAQAECSLPRRSGHSLPSTTEVRKRDGRILRKDRPDGQARVYSVSRAKSPRDNYDDLDDREEESRDSGAESASGADTDTDDDEQASSASGIASWSTPGELACDVDDEDDEEEEDYDDDNQSDTDDAGNEVDDQRASRDSDSRKQDQATAPAYGGLLTDGEAGGSAITTCIHTPMSPYSADAIRSAHFKLVRSGDEWVGYWGKHLPSEKYKSIEPWQKINHFPMSFEIGRKDRLYTNLMAMRSRIGSEMVDFMPETHILPRNRRQLKRVFASHPLWIIKPPASARGNGIRVISKWTDLPKKRELICSRYISDPFLINQRKFDLRLYVVVTSFDPLRIYFYPDGLVRFASEQYKHSVAHKNVRNRFMHLTNYSVSKKHPTKKSQAAADAHVSPPDDTQTKFSMAENKWTIGMLREYMTEHGYAFEPIMDRIKSLLVKTVMSVHAQNMGGVRLYLANRMSCYELFGFDVLLDSELKPWLMEVNISPSMKASCDMDHALKARVAVDLLNLAGYRVRDLELARHAQTSKTPPPWKRPFLTTSERAKQRAAMINEGFDILSNLTPDDLRILRETEDEARARIMFFARRGDFLRLYPSPEYNSHAQYIQSFNYYDRLLYQWTTREPSAERRISLLRGLLKSPSTMRSSGPVELAHQPKRSPSRLAADKQERVAAHAEAFGEASSVVSNVLDSRLIEQRLEKPSLASTDSTLCTQSLAASAPVSAPVAKYDWDDAHTALRSERPPLRPTLGKPASGSNDYALHALQQRAGTPTRQVAISRQSSIASIGSATSAATIGSLLSAACESDGIAGDPSLALYSFKRDSKHAVDALECAGTSWPTARDPGPKMLSFNPLYPGRPVATFASHQGMVIPNVQNASTNAAAAAAAVAALRSIVPTKPGGFQPVRHLHPELGALMSRDPFHASKRRVGPQTSSAVHGRPAAPRRGR
ncbi:Tubulin polyglutamylase ttll4 [Polyrhizophydium stewartii]|uniref:Tubulin polyglutamylase ttll4 n=1 Tax=Polyrhizophydium stewartii TaxID=2732419 RepID=A0ABR4NA26_9FUNG